LKRFKPYWVVHNSTRFLSMPIPDSRSDQNSGVSLDQASSAKTTVPMASPLEPEERDEKWLLVRYRRVRSFTESLTRGLEPEDQVVQSMEDVSPTKWHLAHTSWFWETFLLSPRLPGYEPLNPQYAFLFNSYYVQAGERHCRAQRGYISRPTVSEVRSYRRHVDRGMENLLQSVDFDEDPELAYLVELGLHHEQQHQELLLTDIKHVFSVNPLRPAYQSPERGGDEGQGEPPPSVGEEASGSPGWVEFKGGLHWIGHDGSEFAFDNEEPRHRGYLEPFGLADRLVTCGEYLDFMADGGYERAELWLSEGWATAQEREWSEPFYWEKRDGRWTVFTLGGVREMRPHEPVCHLSYFEADAFARWAGHRLPTEAEWEVAAADLEIRGNLVESNALHPVPVQGEGKGLRQMYGDVWEWTRSQYSPYPGFRPARGAVGEYNGKFMCNQFVLKGGSCVTPGSHLRATYRNFFPPDACWQFTGLRLALDLS